VRGAKCIPLILFFLIVYNSIFAQSTFLTVSKIIERYGKAVVLIATDKKGNGKIGLGSGFIVSPEGVIVTNYHIINGAYPVLIKLTNGDIYDNIDIVDTDSKRDIAIVKIKGWNLPTVKLGNSEDIKIGERVVVIGNPKGLENTVSDGLMSAIRDTGKGFKMHQISAPVSEGSSGSPVFNMKGEVIGIATSSMIEGQNLNFSVPINYAKGMITSETKMSLKEFYKESHLLQERWEPKEICIKDIYKFKNPKYSIDFILAWDYPSPSDITVDNFGYVYVMSYDNNIITKFSPDGSYVNEWNSGFMHYPDSMTIDNLGYVYISGSHTVRIFDSNGDFITELGSRGSRNGQFVYPKEIEVDDTGYIYVVDGGNCRIQKFSPTGMFFSNWGSKGAGDNSFISPAEIAIDKSEFVYIADSATQKIQKFTSSGKFVTSWGSYGTNKGQFRGIYEIEIDNQGYVYVFEDHGRLQIFNSDGEFVKLIERLFSYNKYYTEVAIFNSIIYVISGKGNTIEKYAFK